MKIRKLINAHRFFVWNSRWYVGNQSKWVACRRWPFTVTHEPALDWRHMLYYPIAYCKFMWYELNSPEMREEILDENQETQR